MNHVTRLALVVDAAGCLFAMSAVRMAIDAEQRAVMVAGVDVAANRISLHIDTPPGRQRTAQWKRERNPTRYR